MQNHWMVPCLQKENIGTRISKSSKQGQIKITDKGNVCLSDEGAPTCVTISVKVGQQSSHATNAKQGRNSTK